MFEQSRKPGKSVLSGRTGSKSDSTPDPALIMKQLKRNMTGSIQMFAEDEEKGKVQRKSQEEEELQMKSASAKAMESGEEKQTQLAFGKASAGNKTEMPEEVKSKMENSFGTDFSNVNIHKDSNQATNIGALAYTQGNDVHFAPDQYDPSSQKGQELLGHELTHMVQQREGRVKPDLPAEALQKSSLNLSINSDPTLEKEADEMGAKAAKGKMANVRDGGNGVQKKGEDEGMLSGKRRKKAGVAVNKMKKQSQKIAVNEEDNTIDEGDPIIVGRQNGSGAPVTSTTYKSTIDFVNSRINDVTDSDFIEVLNIAKQGSKLSTGLKAVNNITGYIGAISSLYSVSQGGSPIEGIPLVGSLVGPMWEMSGMSEMEKEIDLMIAKESYGNMVDYALKTPEIGFVYSDQELFSGSEHEGYYIPASYYPTNHPFVCRDDAFYQTEVELFYAYWGYLQEDGSLWVKGKLDFY